MEFYGYVGKILKIDLTRGKIKKEDLNLEDCKKYLGGYGLGMKFLADYLKEGTDPFSPENPLIISSGTLSGTNAPGTPKTSLLTKYPTIADHENKHFIGGSVGGAGFATALKNAGYDHIIITGASSKPVYIKIIDNDVEICDALELWKKKDITQTTFELKKIYGEDASVISIGEAGENLVRLGMAFIDDTDSLGRSGLGAIFGSKKLKAIVARGTQGIKIYDPERFTKKVDELQDKILSWKGREHWIKLGMGAGWYMFKYTQYPGIWPREKWDKLYGEEKRLETLERTIACPSCLISCRIRWKIKDGEFAGSFGQGSPYGKSATSGQLLGIEDHRKMLQLVIIANKAGVDFYSLTRIIDFVTRSFIEGKIDIKDTGGLELKRNYECYCDLFNKTIKREGFGSVLADGWVALQKKTGLNPQDYWYAGICKGVDFIYDARAANLHPLMMSFFTNPRPHHGGLHTLTTGVGHSIEELRNELSKWGIPKDAEKRIFKYTEYAGKMNVARYTRYMEDGMALRNSLGGCSIYAFYDFISPNDYAELFSASTGIEFSATDLMRCGERIMNLKKMLNVREGFSKKDDKIPELWKRPMNSPEGKIETMDYFREKVIKEKDFEKILDDYYEERNWDIKKGIPKERKLKELGLEKYIDWLDSK
ncbi:hypothetical protein ES704_03298 [subsurface metagenome]|jgi:aldehyde:ferredoxin oxidoreductase